MSATGQHNEGMESSTPQLCVTGCGFFANGNCSGMCSKCHREHLADLERKLKADKAAVGPSPMLVDVSPTAANAAPVALQETPAPRPAAAEAAPASPSGDPAVAGPSSGGSGDACKGPTRCGECRKKVGLTGFKCKCGSTFCGQHRYAESHSCPFDYKSVQRQKLAESNPVVQASKVQKI